MKYSSKHKAFPSSTYLEKLRERKETLRAEKYNNPDYRGGIGRQGEKSGPSRGREHDNVHRGEGRDLTATETRGREGRTST